MALAALAFVVFGAIECPPEGSIKRFDLHNIIWYSKNHTFLKISKVDAV